MKGRAFTIPTSTKLIVGVTVLQTDCEVISSAVFPVALCPDPTVVGPFVTNFEAHPISMLGVIRSLLRSRKTKNLRGNLSSKRGNQQFYKGKGCLKTGTISKKGIFLSYPDLDKMLDFHVPDLTGFKLKPYVSYETPVAPKIQD